MANKPSPNSLIHCSQCGEDYSATYKRCPFCGAKNEPSQSDSDRSASSADLEDTYVFDGQDLFDDEGVEDEVPAAPKGGKRLAGKSMSNPFANADINWPRVITFVCSLIIIVAALIIVFTVIYPQLQNPSANNSQSPSSPVSDPGSNNSQDVDPSAAVTDPTVTDPGTDPSADVPPTSSSGLRGFTTNTYGKDEDGFTLKSGESFQLKLTFDPVSWSGEVTYSISDEKYATVSAGGKVTNVNPDSSTHGVILTIAAGGVTMEMPVYCRGVSATQPPASEAPTASPAAGDPTPTPSASGSGTVTVGKKGVIVNVPGGVYVRSSPSTTGDNKIASLFNGDPITVLEDAGNGWYKISFSGSGGKATEGYIKGDYISTN